MIGSPIEEIKNRLGVVEVLGQYLKLHKAGVNFRAVCPFHSEKKPSFFVSPARQIWHCFGCAAGGNIFDFVMKMEGVEFGDALRILAQKAGIELTKQDPRLQTERQRLYEICELAARFFEKQLYESQGGNKAKTYLLDRKISEDSTKAWRIGYAPNEWAALCDFIVGQGYSRDEAEKAGLAIKRGVDDGMGGSRYFDRFRSRIMFPICDFNGKVIGFGGRVFESDDPAKYVNTPATVLYNKSYVLYGLDKAKVDIRKEDACILVEGYIDAIMVSQAGHKNVVATSGTALTPHQLKTLKRYSENLFTAFDMDVAGDNATKRGIDLAQREGFNIKVIMMPEGKDPADVVAEGQQPLGVLLAEARSIMDFYFENTFAKFDFSSAEGKRNIAKVLLPIIKRTPNAIELAHWRQRLASGLRVTESDIEIELKKVSVSDPFDAYIKDEGNGFAHKIAARDLVKKTRREILEEYIVSILLKWQGKMHLIEDRFLGLFSEPMRQILHSLNNSQEPLAVFVTNSAAAGDAKSGEIDPRFRYLFLRAEAQEDEDEKEIDQEIVLAINELRQIERKNNLMAITLALREAERVSDADKAQALLRQFNSIIQES